MATVSVAILGLGRIGASIGLALQRYNTRKDAQHNFEVSYADTRPGIREDAQKLGLADKISRDVIGSAANKDIVVLALPYADVQTAYRGLGKEMRSGAVLLDSSPLKQPSIEWAKTYLSSDIHLVGITPIINPKYLYDGLDDTEHAAVDLFDSGNMLLMPGATCIKEAVELAADFSTLLGSKPHFVDPAEHDSLIAVTEGLPAVIGAAAFYMMVNSSGWGDIQRFTNPSFGRLTHHFHDTHPDDMRDFLLQNRHNLVRQVDELTTALQAFRTILAQDDRQTLESALVDMGAAYDTWINHRYNAQWDDEKNLVKNPSFGSMLMGGIMGTYITKRVTGNKDGDEEE